MRINEPVTDVEHELGTNETLVSRTNLKGVVTYADHDFIALSGFTEDELLKKNHNIVRHPDMPQEAFQSLWDCIKAGDPWIGLIKNRCKNGDYYWVKANVTPTFTRGRISGYLSVRRKPSREEVDAASTLYADIRDGICGMTEASSWSIASAFSRLPLSTQFGLQILALVVAMVTVVGSALLENDVAFTIAALMMGGLLAGLGRWFSVRVYPALTEISRKLRDLADGVFDAEIKIDRQDEIGQVYKDLKSLQIRLTADIEEVDHKAQRATRIRQALDNVATSVVVADAQNNIIYLNNSARELFDTIESDVRTEIADFDAKNLLGSDIDFFGKYSQHQSADLAGLKSSHTGQIEIGGRTLKIVTNPVVDSSNDRIGTAVEWKDLTGELAIQNDVQKVVSGALLGDLSRRISMVGKTGFVSVLSRNINDLVGVSERVISDAARVLEAVADGDLTQSIDEDFVGLFGKLKHGTNATIVKLVEIVTQLQASAASVQGEASEIAQGNLNLSRRTEEQAGNLEETASSMEEINATVRQNADNASQANQLAKAAREEANAGGEVVAKAVEAMNTINTSSKRIADIVSVIDEIAFQTNLLALNASVEAARAGEQGRGFAVVASEVRNLASRSATAAKEIKELITDSVQKVDDGSRLVYESGERLTQIVQGVKKVTDIVGEIAAASHEQAVAIDGVNRALTDMDSLTQQNATLVEQAASASSSLGQEAQGLSALTLFFDVGDGAGEAAAPTERRSAERPWSEGVKPKAEPKRTSNKLDFASAKSKHLTWKSRLRDFLDGKESLSESQAVSHRDCDLGKWLYSQGMKRYGKHAEMQELETIHAEMHSIIRDVVGYKHADKTGLAEQHFEAVGPMSETIIELLSRLEEITLKEAAQQTQEPAPIPVKSPPPIAQSTPEPAAAVSVVPVAAAVSGAVASEDWDEF
jgi:methyl-accepting chemotaxis protein